jgi:uncharacterized protein (DUF302 family)
MRQWLVLLMLFIQLAVVQADEPVKRQKVTGSFAEVKEALVMAIENRGLVINYTSHIADMLARTGADIGSGRKVFAQAEIIEFCSAGLSRKMLEMDPHNIVMCPFAISIYTLPNEANTVWLSYRQPFGKAAGLVGGLLQGVVSEASAP